MTVSATRIMAHALACLVVAILVPAAKAQSEKSKTSTYAKVQAVASKPDANGRQVVTVTIDIDEGYFLIGHTVCDDMVPWQFKMKLQIEGKPLPAEIAYPSGTLEKNELVGDYTTYRGKIVATAVIRRTVGDTASMEVAVTMQGYPKSRGY
jgi:hypothetical protein